MNNYLVRELLHYCNVSFDQCQSIPKSTITYYELTFVLKGKMVYTADNNTYVLNKNDAILLPPGTLRSRLDGLVPVKYVSFNFNTFTDAKIPLAPFIPNCISEDIKKLVAVFPQSHLSPHYHARQKVTNILNYILFELLDIAELKTNNEHALKIIKYVEEHITEKMTLQSISQEIGLTKEYTAFLFKKETGKTVTEYLNGRKMFLAKELIIHNETNLTNLATYLGYDNYNYFSRLFKRYFNISPRQLKNRNN